MAQVRASLSALACGKPQGVTVQVYCSLIAALLLSARCGRLPTKRQMEALRYRMLGWIDDEELSATLDLAEKRG